MWESVLVWLAVAQGLVAAPLGALQGATWEARDQSGISGAPRTFNLFYPELPSLTYTPTTPTATTTHSTISSSYTRTTTANKLIYTAPTIKVPTKGKSVPVVYLEGEGDIYPADLLNATKKVRPINVRVIEHEDFIDYEIEFVEVGEDYEEYDQKNRTSSESSVGKDTSQSGPGGVTLSELLHRARLQYKEDTVSPPSVQQKGRGRGRLRGRQYASIAPDRRPFKHSGRRNGGSRYRGRQTTATTTTTTPASVVTTRRVTTTPASVVTTSRVTTTRGSLVTTSSVTTTRGSVRTTTKHVISLRPFAAVLQNRVKSSGSAVTIPQHLVTSQRPLVTTSVPLTTSSTSTATESSSLSTTLSKVITTVTHAVTSISSTVTSSIPSVTSVATQPTTEKSATVSTGNPLSSSRNSAVVFKSDSTAERTRYTVNIDKDRIKSLPYLAERPRSLPEDWRRSTTTSSTTGTTLPTEITSESSTTWKEEDTTVVWNTEELELSESQGVLDVHTTDTMTEHGENDSSQTRTGTERTPKRILPGTVKDQSISADAIAKGQYHEINPGQYTEVNPGQYHETNPGQYHEVNPGQYHEVNPGQVEVDNVKVDFQHRNQGSRTYNVQASAGEFILGEVGRIDLNSGQTTQGVRYTAVEGEVDQKRIAEILERFFGTNM